MELHLEVQMERISYWLQMIVDCMLNNNLSIDKATFFTVIIGQITIYGILLTFYQFVASYQGGEKAATRYLGINITEYFVKKKIKIFNKIISKKMFGMFGGTEERVKLLCDNELANVILDRFGRDVNLIPKGEKQFTVNVDVAVSRQFVFWVMGLGDGAKIVAPESVVSLVQAEIERLQLQYKKE